MVWKYRHKPPHTHNHFMTPSLGPPRWASARSLFWTLVQAKTTQTGRHTDHPATAHLQEHAESHTIQPYNNSRDTILTTIFSCELGQASFPSVFFLHLLQKRTFENKWHRFEYKLDALQNQSLAIIVWITGVNTSNEKPNVWQWMPTQTIQANWNSGTFTSNIQKTIFWEAEVMSAEKRISFKGYLGATDVKKNVQIKMKNVKKHDKSKTKKWKTWLVLIINWTVWD